MCVAVLLDACSLSLVHDHSMTIHLRFSNAIELFQYSNKHEEHKSLRGELRSYNSVLLASISNTLLKVSSMENFSNIHYVKMTAEFLNFQW